MSKKRYKTVIPDISYYENIFNCYSACPARTKAGNYVTAISGKSYEYAYNVAVQPNPFAFVCGRVCAHPCEIACRRALVDKPISIRALKRFATEKHNPSLGHFPNIKKSPSNGRKIAIIGAGPAGLSAAYNLALMGYSVTVFEKGETAGGMMFMGLPKYRLPRDVVREEIDAILSLGVTLILNKAVGRDFTLADLRGEGYEGIFIAIGSTIGKGLNIPGIELDGVLNGIDFLLNINLGYKVNLGKKVIIIGGGNVAIDVARSVVRHVKDLDKLSKEELKDTIVTMQSVLHRIEQEERRKLPRKYELRTAFDVARSLMRMGIEDIDVAMICLESREEMPAHDYEIEEAKLEGINIMPALGPRCIHGKDGKVVGLETINVQSLFDASGRFNPSYIAGTNQIIEADTIMLAIGQSPDLSFITPGDNITISNRGTIQVDRNTLKTTADGIFAGGDAAFGARLIIDAVGDGKKAAAAIDNYINNCGENIKPKGSKMTKIKSYKMPDRYDTIPRKEPPSLPVDRRIGFTEVELCYSEEDAVTEGKRCLKCYVNTIFDSSKCVLCGGCIDVCPEYCLKIVKLTQLESVNNDISLLIEKVYGKPLDAMTEEEKNDIGAAIIKDEERCIRCALCMERCPADAITMERFEIGSK